MALQFVIMALLIVGAVAAPRFKDKTPEIGCNGKPAELYFLLDSSSSIWSVDFTTMKTFVNEVINIFDVSPTHTRVGAGSFSDKFREDFSLLRHSNKTETKEAVSEITQMLGGTYTYDALDGVRSKGLNKDIVRPGVVRIAIVITDGESNDKQRTKEAARKLKHVSFMKLMIKKSIGPGQYKQTLQLDDDVTVFAVGVGRRTDIKELRAIASEPSEQFVFTVSNFDLLQSIREELAMSACAVELQDAPSPGPACGAENAADVIFVADSSQLNESRMEDIFDFIADVNEDFNTENGNIQTGIETRYCGSGNLRLGRYDNKVDLLDAVRKTKTFGLHHLLKRLRTHGYQAKNGGRISARNMAVVFVDDELGDKTAVLEQAKLAKADDIELFVVAIGDKVNEEDLKAMSSGPVDRHFISVDSYDELKVLKPKFLSHFCHGL